MALCLQFSHVAEDVEENTWAIIISWQTLTSCHIAHGRGLWWAWEVLPHWCLPPLGSEPRGHASGPASQLLRWGPPTSGWTLPWLGSASLERGFLLLPGKQRFWWVDLRTAEGKESKVDPGLVRHLAKERSFLLKGIRLNFHMLSWLRSQERPWDFIGEPDPNWKKKPASLGKSCTFGEFITLTL